MRMISKSGIKKIIKSPYALIILVVLILASYFISDLRGSDEFVVRSVIDGDSIVLDDDESTNVRFLGMDAPEILIYGSPGDPLSEEARRLNQSLLGGAKIKLEFDAERYDDYGRTLAYVFVDNVFVNEEIVRNGLARALIINPNKKYADRIFKAQDEAKREKRGIWGDLSTIKPPNENNLFLIKPSDATRHIDQRVVTRGKITNFRKSDKVKVLRLEEELDIVLFPDSWGNFNHFNIKPEEYYLGKPVEVIGKISMYRGRPNVIISHPMNIRVLN